MYLLKCSSFSYVNESTPSLCCFWYVSVVIFKPRFFWRRFVLSRYGRVLVSLLSNNDKCYKKMIKEKTVSLILFLNFFFLLQLWFSFLCVRVSVGSHALRVCVVGFFFFLPSILCKAAHEVFVRANLASLFFSCFVVWSCTACCFFFYCPCSSRSCCERLCAYVRSFNVFVQVHRTFFSSRSRSLGQKCWPYVSRPSTRV